MSYRVFSGGDFGAGEERRSSGRVNWVCLTMSLMTEKSHMAVFLT